MIKFKNTFWLITVIVIVIDNVRKKINKKYKIDFYSAFGIYFRHKINPCQQLYLYYNLQ